MELKIAYEQAAAATNYVDSEAKRMIAEDPQKGQPGGELVSWADYFMRYEELEKMFESVDDGARSTNNVIRGSLKEAFPVLSLEALTQLSILVQNCLNLKNEHEKNEYYKHFVKESPERAYNSIFSFATEKESWPTLVSNLVNSEHSDYLVDKVVNDKHHCTFKEITNFVVYSIQFHKLIRDILLPIMISFATDNIEHTVAKQKVLELLDAYQCKIDKKRAKDPLVRGGVFRETLATVDDLKSIVEKFLVSFKCSFVKLIISPGPHHWVGCRTV
jgi:hypothetical protein